ncbi:Uncharacterised protein [Mycobacteroides abscessus subsp. abscessus]|nr:Uncharacterised protein [Mycobacteroides abscessus subsp. abscessus]
MWPRCTSTASNPASIANLAAFACAAITASISPRVAFFANRIDNGLKNRTGANAGALLVRGLATGPACPICALIAAPSACTASVNLCSPGRASGRIHNCHPSVRPPGDTAQ